MLKSEVLIVKFITIDRFPSASVKLSKITSLNHKIWNDSVENGALVVKRLAGLANSLLASAESAEVLSSLWDVVSEQTKDDTSLLATLNLHVKEDLAGDHFPVRFGVRIKRMGARRLKRNDKTRQTNYNLLGSNAEDKEGESKEDSREDLHV